MTGVLGDVGEALWEFLAACGSDDESRSAIESRSRDDLVELFGAFVQLRADVACELTSLGLVVDASEDTLDDLAEGIVLEGRTAVQEILSGHRSLPPRERWGRLRGITHIVSESYHDRFGGEIFDELE